MNRIACCFTGALVAVLAGGAAPAYAAGGKGCQLAANGTEYVPTELIAYFPASRARPLVERHGTGNASRI
jgi:hypothetical protein